MAVKRLIDAGYLMSVLDPQHLANRGVRFVGMRSGRTIEIAKLLLTKLLEDTPTIDAVEVVHGRWEKVQVWKDNQQTTLRCSLCKTNQPIYEHDEWKFCPFCGQPMDGGQYDNKSV